MASGWLRAKWVVLTRPLSIAPQIGVVLKTGGPLTRTPLKIFEFRKKILNPQCEF